MQKEKGKIRRRNPAHLRSKLKASPTIIKMRGEFIPLFAYVGGCSAHISIECEMKLLPHYAKLPLEEESSTPFSKHEYKHRPH